MAESAKETRKGRRPAANYSEDSVEAEFGGDYSEASLEVIRQLGRKGAQCASVEQWEEEAVQAPPQEECDAAVEELKSLERALDAVKQYVPSPKELAWIDYKRALVEDASENEITWLKLKAYHHGMDALRASSQAADAAPASGDTGAGAAAAPGTSEPAAATSASALSTDVDAARQGVLQAIRAVMPSSSGDEEDSAALLMPLAASRHPGSQRPASTSLAGAGASTPALLASTAAPPAVAPAHGAIYHPDYLEEIRLEQQLAQQRQQRSSAFVLGLAAAVGISVLRWWVRRKRQGNGGGAAAAAARRPTPQQSMS